MAEYFPHLNKIKYEGPDSKDPMAFKHYNADEKIAGMKMRDHFRFSVAFWHTFKGTGTDPFGSATMVRPYGGGSPMKVAQDTMRAAFEFFTKLGIDFYCFHDRDIAPEGKDLAETNKNLDKIVGLADKLQADTGVKLLWGTANLFSHPRYMCGAATNPDPAVFAHAAAQVKKAIEVTKRLGGSNYVFWGGREGYETLLNSDMGRELDHLGRFLNMAVDYAEEIGFKGQFLIEPKPKEPTKHQYDFDAQSCYAFLQKYGLLPYFKLNLESNHGTLAAHTFEHELTFAAANDILGSIDANRGDLLLGWDTDQFPTNLYETTFIMYIVLSAGGLAPGGLNFDAKVRRSSFEPMDLFHAHIGGMDAFARGLKIAVKMREDRALDDFIKRRYAGWNSGIGKRIEQGKATFADCEKFILKSGEPKPVSGRQEMLENIVNEYIR
ncbi:MAG: xylose isomerase [Planctomycetota bacterium]